MLLGLHCCKKRNTLLVIELIVPLEPRFYINSTNNQQLDEMVFNESVERV